MEIQSYNVGINRQRNANHYHRRFITLTPKNSSSTVEKVVIYFFVQESVTHDANVGYVTPDSSKHIIGFAPISDFDDMLKILQTEETAHFYWTADSHNKLYWFGLGTGDEPPVEGLADRSVND